ncbi:Retrovirus-related Pol polyprotein from type-1 retrotransposable element R1 [Araneus ventricosus]|uniref:Retrovirus-related Pol polyprotein from type-1 retrotransposable element R1 n=1 Tax=Araneus ventricosus TaxID=182803 RepID=A0A4Y2UQT6_ARAVE|nr:Retrovirus-related Pol polyprotein from type-1 retrotransposable element R1 [Araneus ventricosus]
MRSDVRRAQRKYYSAKDPKDRRYLRMKWKKVVAEYKRSLNTALRDDWSEVCERVTPEEPFGTYFQVAKNPDRRHFQLCSTTKADGTITLTPEDTVETLLDFHFPTDRGDMEAAHSVLRGTSRMPPDSPEDPPFSIFELEEAFRSLNNKKAPGPDGLHADVVKEVFATNTHYFHSLFNSCLQVGHFPKRWKTAQVVIFHKPKKKETDPSSLRPISLLDFFGKALDKLVTQRLFHHLLSNSHLHEHQFGFTPGRSAPEAIILLKSWIATARQQEKHSVVVSLDIKSAFSRVWWPLVLHNLKKYDCPRSLFRMVASFLSDRQVSMDYGTSTVTRSYSTGCPQGSNSGPLLWLLIANDALSLHFAEDVKILAYAVDFYLFVAATGKHVIQAKVREALAILEDWSKSAKVEFAHEKTQLIPFGKKGRQKHPPYCSFAGKAIKLTRNMKMLGVILDDGLTGVAHLTYIRGKIAKILNRLTIARGRRGLSGKVLKVLYKRALERILTYAAPAWCTGTVRQIDKVNSIQRQALLAISGAFRTTSTAALQVICGIIPSSLVCEMEVAIFQLKHRQTHVSFLGEELTGLDLEVFHNTWIHPSARKTVQWDKEHPSSSLSIYTDGSKLDGKVGAAFHVKEGTRTVDFQYRLKDHSSVFQAELSALHQALIWKHANRPHHRCDIFTDSMSALKVLQKPRNNLVEDVKAILDDTVSLHWVKAHVGIEGNEAADKASKEATTKPNIDLHLDLPIRSLKTILKGKLLEHWQKTWEDRENTKGRFTYDIFPRVSTSRCLDNGFITQAVSNHGRFPSYFRRFNIKTCSFRCGEDTADDVLHYAFFCPLVAHLRHRINSSHSLLQVITDRVMAKELCFILQYLNEHEEDIIQLEE